MSKDPRTDQRNIKQTQLDRGQVIKGSFSEFSSALRTTSVNGILTDSYSHFVQELDDQGRVTSVKYYQANLPAIDQITFVADVSSSLSGKYIVIEDFLTDKKYTFYITIGGIGATPDIGDIKTKVNISENDPASVVCIAFQSAIDSIAGLSTTKKSVIADSLEVSYESFGEAEPMYVDGTGFTIVRLQEGTSVLVGEVELSYDDDGNVIYNGSTLKGLTYNPFTASFEVSTVSVIPDNGEFMPVEIQNSETQVAMMCVLGDILRELKKMNIYNSIILEDDITNEDIE